MFLRSLVAGVAGRTVQLRAWSETDLNQPESADGERIELRRPSLVLAMVWFVLAATASIILLATTNLLCQEVASIPFLWILPLKPLSVVVHHLFRQASNLSAFGFYAVGCCRCDRCGGPRPSRTVYGFSISDHCFIDSLFFGQYGLSW